MARVQDFADFRARFMLKLPPSRSKMLIEQQRASRTGNSSRRGTGRTSEMAISQKIKDLIFNAWVDGAPCLVATAGRNGPNISPKGSMLVFDDGHLAYWERSKRQ